MEIRKKTRGIEESKSIGCDRKEKMPQKPLL